jgi:hypothetical protein
MIIKGSSFSQNLPGSSQKKAVCGFNQQHWTQCGDNFTEIKKHRKCFAEDGAL